MMRKITIILILGLLLIAAGRTGVQAKALAASGDLPALLAVATSTQTPTPTGVAETDPAAAETESALSETPESGSDTETPDTGTEAPTQIIVITSTPRENGSIIHLVQKGEALWNIAMAYDVSVEQLIALNNLDVKNPVIYAGQKLVVRAAFTPTPTTTVTLTPRPPTITSRPTATRRPPRATRTPNLTETAVALAPERTGVSRQTVGIGIIIVSSLGLLALLATGLIKKK